MSAEVWYVDTSAFVKLLVAEDHSEALRAWLDGRRAVSSDLLRTEARRAVLDEPAGVRRRCEELLPAVASVRLRASVLDRAGKMPVRQLRSLDAIHLAAAQEFEDALAGIVSYDRRQLDAAAALGIVTVSPGT